MLHLPLSRRAWAPCADAPRDWSFQKIFEEQLQPLPHGVILQGCNETLARVGRSGDAGGDGGGAAGAGGGHI